MREFHLNGILAYVRSACGMLSPESFGEEIGNRSIQICKNYKKEK